MIVSFTDYYNTIFIDKFLSNTKIGKDSWYFDNYPLRKPAFSLTTEFSFF